MMSKFLVFILLSVVSAPVLAPDSAAVSAPPPDGVTIKSPDGLLSVSAGTDAPGNVLSYTVRFGDQAVITSSPLGLKLGDGTMLGQHCRVLGYREGMIKMEWRPLYAERREIPDNYREATISLQQKDAPFLKFNMIVRAYDEGIAFRYEIPGQDTISQISVEKELTAFTFSKDDDTWATYTAQGLYKEVKLSQVRDGVERPLTVEISDTLYAAIGEAGVINYARTKFSRSETNTIQLVTSADGRANAGLPFQSPWRFVMVGRTPGALLEHNYLLLNLNEANRLTNTSWIKPGKVIREMTLTTKGSLACIDFAAGNGLQYIEFDAGWYGKEGSDTSDATRVSVDPARSAGPLDMKRVLAYAKSKDIGVILYVNRQAFERQFAALLPLYKAWGVKGIKLGFVNVGTQQAESRLTAAIREAARYHLMVDIHDEYRPTGYTRTYPNFMTLEGVRGDEESPDNTQTLITLFTRMIAGPADHTVCYFDARVAKMGSHASQMAKAICLYSPWQFIFWYDSPPGSPAAGSPVVGSPAAGSSAGNGESGSNDRVIRDVPELSFFRELPTVWDDTKVLEGAIGQFATIARRSGNSWYIGSINSDTEHRLNIRFDFLDPSKQYNAVIYTDSKDSDSPTGVRIERRVVNRSTLFAATIKPNNGLVIVLNPVK
jgi:alpha-glucosidase